MSDQVNKSEVGANLIVSKDRTPVEVEGQAIVLSALEGFNELTDRQQKYLHKFALNPFSPTSHAMTLGYSPSEVDKWFSQDDFSKAADLIKRVYEEVLKGKDFEESLTNSKIRARVIRSLENDGKYREEKDHGTKNINFIGGSFKDIAGMLRD